jgi:dinuclear metal center YbgI/SA1388 family protein
MTTRDEIVAYLREYLRVDAFPDYGPQGLQFEGREDVRRIVTGVSAGQSLFQRAAEAGADMVLVHHGLFWDNDPRVIVGPLKRRLALLMRHDMSLCAYHLCLDAHPEVGNNYLAARALGMVDMDGFGLSRGNAIGVRGRFPAPMPRDEFISSLRALYGGQPLVFPHGPDPLETAAIVSGGAQRLVTDAIAAGLDALVTGEASEFVMNAAQEGGITFVAAGHYNTETLGIFRLGDHLAEKFDLEHTFIDLPNPV